MTKRERRRIIASAGCYTINEEKAFQKGARWADATMIENACEWIKENMPKYINFEEGFIYEVDMADDFRKAMEE